MGENTLVSSWGFCMHVRLHTRTHVCVYTHMHADTHIHMHMHRHACTHAHTHKFFKNIAKAQYIISRHSIVHQISRTHSSYLTLQLHVCWTGTIPTPAPALATTALFCMRPHSCDWLVLFNLMSPNSSILPPVTGFSSISGWMLLHCVYRTHLLSPLIQWWVSYCGK